MSNDTGETAGHSATDAAVAVQLQGLVLDTADMAEFLDNFAKFTAAKLSIGGEVFCGITLARRKKYHTVGSSGPRAQALDEMQYGFGDGPCLSAIREARTELVSDVRGIARLSDARLNLVAAMESRTAIDTAVGVIMAQNRCSQEAAFATLKRASSSRNVKLREIAASVLASVAQDPSVVTHFES